MTEVRREASHSRWRVLFLVFSCAIIALWFVWPQQTISVRDEANYLGVAQFFVTHGALDVTESKELRDGLVPWLTRKHGQDIPQHPLGVSFLAVPFVALGGWKAAYLLAVLTFLAGGWIFSRLLEREGAPVSLSVLYFLFPPFLLYSRTFMADIPSMVLCLLAFWLLARGPLSLGRSLGGGLVLGAAFLIKSPNILFAAPLAVAVVVRALRAREGGLAAATIVPLAAGIAIQLGLNTYFLGRPFSFSYNTADMFRLQHVVPNLQFYLLAWTIVLPGLWLGAVEMAKRKRWPELAAVVSGLSFYSIYSYIDQDSSFWVGLVRGQRFLLPYAGLLLVYYAAFWSERGLRRWADRLAPIGLALALLGFGLASVEQRQRAAGTQRVGEWVYAKTEPGETILYNRDSCEFVHGIYGERDYYRLDRGEQFEPTLASLPASVQRIVVVETDHRFRKGVPYAAAFIRNSERVGWKVIESHELPGGIVLAWAERISE